jgi:hypothetical protein
MSALRHYTAPERELSLAYPLGQFDAGQRNGGTPERLEASHHRGASAFDRSMILLYEIVEVLVTSHLYIGYRPGGRDRRDRISVELTVYKQDQAPASMTVTFTPNRVSPACRASR